MGLIRFFLALSVVASHAGSLPFVGTLVGGKLAVQIFFLLSGFYMALVLHEKYTSPGEFYWDRFSRILSGYWVALAISFVLMASVGVNLFTSILDQPWSASEKLFAFIANVTLVGADWSVFTYPTGNGIAFTSDFTQESTRFHPFMYISPAWSLPVELSFYLLAPLLVRSWRILLLAAACSVASRIGTYSAFGVHDPWTYRFMPSELVFFALGMSVYHLRKVAQREAFTHHVGVILAMAVLGSLFVYPTLSPSPTRSLIDVAIIVGIGVSAPFIFEASKNNKLDRFLGDISFPIYLIHVPILRAWAETAGALPPPLYIAAASVLAAGPMHFLSSRLDRKIRSIFRRRQPPRAVCDAALTKKASSAGLLR